VGADSHDVSGNPDQGAAYVFRRSGTTWSQQQQLIASDGAAGDQFGHSVGILRDTAVVGAPLKDVAAGVEQGGAYVFVRSGSNWMETQQLLASDGAAGDQFGVSVSLTRNALIVGAWADDVNTNTDQGSASLFKQSRVTLP